MRNFTPLPSPFPNFLSILILLFFFSEGNLLTAQNYALEFDGTDDLINLQSPISLDVNNTVTLETWVFPVDLSSRQTIYSTRNGGSSGCWQLEIGKGNNNNNVVAVTGPGTWVAVSEDNAVVPDQWNHVAFVRNGESDKGTFYVNGRELSLQQQTDFTFIDNNDDKTIGNSFKGQIDEVRIWNVARTQEEIQQNMMQSLDGTEAGLAVHFQLNEGAGTTTGDNSSNANTGTIQGDPQWVEDVFPDEAGTEEDPFIIASAFELYWLSVSPNVWDKFFQQTNTIDASKVINAWNLDQGFIPIGNNNTTNPVAFSGTYDGQGFAINNLIINRPPSGQDQGLFGYTNSAIIKNTHVINADINASDNAGGLIGNANGSTISSCSASGTVIGNNQTGGLIGTVNQNTSVNNSYSMVLVTGEGNTGGLIGKTISSVISNTYSIGSVSGNTNVGGLIGSNDNSTVSASYWDQESSGQESSDGGTVKSTSEMTAQATYIDAGWDFEGESNNGTENIWNINEIINSGYPYISNQTVPPTVITGEKDISTSPPTMTGEITSLGTSTILDHGFCWNTSGSPTVQDNKTSKGETDVAGPFTSEITGLSDLLVFYIRAYATNEAGTAYGEEERLLIGAHFDGMGTEDNPFKIYTLSDLKTMGEHSFYLNKHFIQMNDIDAYETRTWNEGEGWNSISTFSGVYDGQRYHIKNLYINSYDNSTGLFGTINGGKVSNLGIINAYISSGGSSGALSGKSYSAEITNCFSTGSIIGKTTNTYGFPTSSTSLGGLIGWVGSGSFISQCYSSANVSAGTNNLNGGMWIGGLSGMVQYATLINSYSTGSARGYTRVGGLTGSMENSDIENSYSTASVSGNEYAGGVAGYSGFPLSVNSFHDQNKTGVSDRGASTTEEMTSQTFFTDAGWDFIGENGSEDIWDINPEINSGYPFLASQSYPHELITDDASAITATTATASAEISILGSEPVVNYGICWNISGAPTLDDPKTQEGEATQSINFSAEITSLSPNTTYYVRAYIKDEKRITYGNEVSFTTDIKELTIGGSFSIDDKIFDETTNANISENNLTLEGIVNNDNVSLSNISATFAQAESGSGILVSITNAELTGDNAGNYVLSLNGAPITTANILEEYQLSLAASPSEGGAVTGEGTYVGGFSVSISAPPAIGWEFVNWTDTDDNVVSDQQDYNYTMPSVDLTLTANFELIDYQITINDTPDVGGTTTGSGTANYNDVVAISATPETGYQFVEWTGDDTQYLDDATAASASLTMPAAAVSLTANFELVDYQITINDTPDVGGTTTGSGTANFGEVVTISATPETGYQFVEWTGDDTQYLDDVTAASASLTMPAADVSLTANFELVDYQITINDTPDIGGTTTGSGTANYNEVVLISATPETGYQFVEWSGDTQYLDDATSASATLTMPAADVYLTANFMRGEYQLTTIASPSGGGTVSGDGLFQFQEPFSVLAEPAEGFAFEKWTVDFNSTFIYEQPLFEQTMPPFSFTFTAHFVKTDYQLTLSKNINEGGTVSGGGTYIFGDEATITANPTAGFIFVNWTDANDNIVSNQQSYSYSMPSDDVTLTANFALATSISKSEDVRPMVWPNPFDDKINIGNIENIKRIVIASQSGQIVYEKVNPDKTINTSGFKSGIYILKIVDTDGKVSLHKLIKQ